MTHTGTGASAPLVDLRAARLPAGQYAQNFCDAHPPLNLAQAKLEADRCYYCFDAPCIAACPTGIPVPSFIQRIADGNLRGAAEAILSANPLGGLCARVCPTEVLCEQACVRNTQDGKPVEIGLLQRYATDHHMTQPGAPLFTRAAPTGKTVAVVGAGPAGLACAHGLARLGHAVVVFDAHPKPGGLNEYGLATYKTVDNFAQREIDWLLSIGGIDVRNNVRLGRDVFLADLVRDYAAVFLGLGLAGVNDIGISEPDDLLTTAQLRSAVDFIAELRQAPSFADVPVGRRVVVIGGGMTAVDAAVQCKKLGASVVHLVYRRGRSSMGASTAEQDWALVNGVVLHQNLAPVELVRHNGQISAVRFAEQAMRDGQLCPTGRELAWEADVVLKAIGQRMLATDVQAGDDLALTLQQGRIATDAAGQTSHPKVWAGGDCRFGGRDLTVEAVQHGKQAALSIHAALQA
jgi:dihydropyrimidine dehydrogenase (NAD+) subunit PreT